MGFTGGITSKTRRVRRAPAPQAAGTQFITGTCASDADCASGCCAFTTGKCAGAIIALQRDGGCGFGEDSPNGDAAKALGFTGAIPGEGGAAAAPAAGAGAAAPAAPAKAPGTQFITGECTSDADCASTCCGATSGKCAAPLVAAERGEGCGFNGAK
jgi:hypothetical protein